MVTVGGDMMTPVTVPGSGWLSSVGEIALPVVSWEAMGALAIGE
jgi:hypothetical protein